MSFLEEIMLEIENMELGEEDSFFEPGEEVKRGEKVIGQINNSPIRKFYILANRYSSISQKSLIKARKTQSDQESLELLSEAFKFERKARVLYDIFWISINDHFSLWNQPFLVGIRKNWQVVLFEPPFPPIAIISPFI